MSVALAFAPESELIVETVDVGSPFTQRLAELGVRPGVHLRTIQHTAGGGLLIDVAGSRIALDSATTRAITVRPAS